MEGESTRCADGATGRVHRHRARHRSRDVIQQWRGVCCQPAQVKVSGCSPMNRCTTKSAPKHFACPVSAATLQLCACILEHPTPTTTQQRKPPKMLFLAIPDRPQHTLQLPACILFILIPIDPHHHPKTTKPPFAACPGP